MLIKKPENRSKVLVAGKSMAFADFTNAVLEFVRSYPTGPQSPFSPCARRIATVCFTVFPFCPILGGIGAIIGAADPQILWLIVAAADVGAALGLALLPLPRTDPQARAAAFLKRWCVWPIVLARFSAPRAERAHCCGNREMPAHQFQIANWASALLWAFVLLSPRPWDVKWVTDYPW